MLQKLTLLFPFITVGNYESWREGFDWHKMTKEIGE